MAQYRIKLFTVVSLLLIVLSACSESPQEEDVVTIKEVESSDGLFSLKVSDRYRDQLPNRQRLVNVRMPGIDPNQLTLLQSDGDDYSSDLIYAITIPVPKRLQFDFKKSMEAMAEGLQDNPQIYHFKQYPIEGEENQTFYSAENKIGTVVMYEYCFRGLIEQENRSLLLVCSASSKGMDRPKKIIESITLSTSDAEEVK